MDFVQPILDFLRNSWVPLLTGTTLLAVLCAVLGWRGWKQDSLDRLANNVVGAHALANLGLYLVSVILVTKHYGLLGLLLGIIPCAIATLILAQLLRWLVEFSILTGVSIAQLFRVPQSGSIFNDPSVLAKVADFMRRNKQE